MLRAFGGLAAFLLLVSMGRTEPAAMPAAPGTEVDVQLVLAADASGSMRAALRRAQRNGFAAAFRDPRLQRAIASGPVGRIAVTYVEWSGIGAQRVIVPWRTIASPADAGAFADELERSRPGRQGGRTSISGALLFAERLIAGSPYSSRRKVVDLSGNGVNDSGPSPRDLPALEEAGITVNALPFASGDEDPFRAMFAATGPDLADYFRREVMRGPGAFVAEIGGDADIAAAILRKLVIEIASGGNAGAGMELSDPS